jgi:UDP-2-acetamido-3-amino-2,3-dideoxy-glucuronate N-acetyltransferase
MISLRQLGEGLTSVSDSVEIGSSGIKVYRLQNLHDARGSLAIADFEHFHPFYPKRIFYIFNVPEGETRGGHAHKECKQFLICLGGECTVEARNGTESYKIQLDSPLFGLSLPRMTWSTQFNFTDNSTLLVLASDAYLESDYIRDFNEYLLEYK